MKFKSKNQDTERRNGATNWEWTDTDAIERNTLRETEKTTVSKEN